MTLPLSKPSAHCLFLSLLHTASFSAFFALTLAHLASHCTPLRLLRLLTWTPFAMHGKPTSPFLSSFGVPQILLRESAAAAGAIVGYQHGFRVSRGDKDPRSSWCIVPPEHCVSLLEGVVGRLQQWAQGQGPGEADDELLGGSTSSDYTQYRSRLVSSAAHGTPVCSYGKQAREWASVLALRFRVEGLGLRSRA